MPSWFRRAGFTSEPITSHGSEVAEQKWRNLLPHEHQLLTRLLAVSFPGDEQLREQLKTARVTTIDSDGSLRFWGAKKGGSAASHIVPVEGYARDRDGIPIQVLLHVVEGRLDELEIFKTDGSPVVLMPPASAFTIVGNPSDSQEVLLADPVESLPTQR